MRELKFRVAHYNLEGFRGFTYFSICKDSFLDDQSRGSFANTIIKSIEQYTGLKDKNGTEIYEGDLVSDYQGKNSYEIVFKNGCWMWGVDDFCALNITEDLEFQDDDLSKCQIVGNIHKK